MNRSSLDHHDSLVNQFDDIGIYLYDFSSHSQKQRKQTESVSGCKSDSKQKGLPIKKKEDQKQLVAKSFGRWKYREHFIYMEVVRQNLSQKELILALEQQLPGRSVSQIRAHHQKMMYKFSGRENMLKAYPNSERNRQLIQMCNILDLALQKITSVKTNIKSVLETEIDFSRNHKN